MWRAVFVGWAFLLGCLPADPPGFRRDAGVRSKPNRAKTSGGTDAGRATARLRTKPSSEAALVSSASAATLLAEEFSDDFERADLGPDWNATSSVWRIENGRLCGERAKNRGVWLARRLPKNARIEFVATSGSPNGDIKAEVWGDGASAAKGTSYVDATSYIVIFGGWKNSLHVLARLNEHGSDRLEHKLVPGSDDPRTRPVSEGRSYRFEIERSDGHTVRFTVDDTLLHSFDDPEPLAGPGHEYFGFNDWDVPVCFDDVLVTPLPG
jgi:hypothetical protein